MPDPLIALAYAAAVTKTLRLATGILILPQRHPLYVAKEVASLDVLSGGRLILGIGVGWLEEEFQALGIPFAERAARTAETVRAMRSLWKPEPEAFSGKFFRWGPSSRTLKPVSSPACPIVVGGHTRSRRAARPLRRRLLPGVTDEDKPSVAARESCVWQGGTRPGGHRDHFGTRAPTPTACGACRILGVSRFMVPPRL
jgi:probable F420-dependent oxidoreductase